jgi:hypothetical protein
LTIAIGSCENADALRYLTGDYLGGVHVLPVEYPATADDEPVATMRAGVSRLRLARRPGHEGTVQHSSVTRTVLGRLLLAGLLGLAAFSLRLLPVPNALNPFMDLPFAESDNAPADPYCFDAVPGSGARAVPMLVFVILLVISSLLLDRQRAAYDVSLGARMKRHACIGRLGDWGQRR